MVGTTKVRGMPVFGADQQIASMLADVIKAVKLTLLISTD
jgi:hypothetical protein